VSPLAKELLCGLSLSVGPRRGGSSPGGPDGPCPGGPGGPPPPGGPEE
jgi:hypothetical protein